MGILQRLIARDQAASIVERREPVFGHADGEQRHAWDLDPRRFDWSLPRTLANAGADAVLSNLSVAARCVALLSETLASVPLDLFQREANGARRAVEGSSLASVLGMMANPQMTAFETREFLVASIYLAGNAYAVVERDRTGQVTAMWPIAPGRVQVERLASGRLRYRISGNDQRAAVYVQDEILHLRYRTSDGLVGRSPLQIARGALAIAMAASDTAGSLMENSLRPSVVASHPGKLSDKARVNIAESFEAKSGPRLAGRVMVLEEGMKAEPLSFSPHDAEFMQQRKFSHEDVCRVFGVPPTSVGIGDRVTFATAEQEARALVQNTIAPLARRVESGMMRCLLSTDARRTFFIEHDLAGLLRGDMNTRFEAYRIAREIGVFSPNDIRRRENEPPIENGDEYIRPLNMAPLGTPAPVQSGAPGNG